MDWFGGGGWDRCWSEKGCEFVIMKEDIKIPTAAFEAVVDKRPMAGWGIGRNSV